MMAPKIGMKSLRLAALAERDFGVTRHWRKRIVRPGTNTRYIVGDNPPMRPIEENDIVFVYLGSPFEEWEAYPVRMRDRDALGCARHWILEIDLILPDRSLADFTSVC